MNKVNNQNLDKSYCNKLCKTINYVMRLENMFTLLHYNLIRTFWT